MAFFIAFDEQLRPNDTVLVDEVRSGIWNAIEVDFSILLPGHFRVFQRVGDNGLALCITQQREGNFLLVCKRFEYRNGVVADADDLHPGVFESLRVFLQLDQLLLAVWSPPGGAVEDERDDVVLAEFLQALLRTALIFQRELGCCFARFDTSLLGHRIRRHNEPGIRREAYRDQH
jgi:hypothetical protein